MYNIIHFLYQCNINITFCTLIQEHRVDINVQHEQRDRSTSSPERMAILPPERAATLPQNLSQPQIRRSLQNLNQPPGARFSQGESWIRSQVHVMTNTTLAI